MKRWFAPIGLVVAAVGVLFGLRSKRQRGHREWSRYTDRIE
ncbi:hypothetical protein [Brevibacterium samyangense]